MREISWRRVRVAIRFGGCGILEGYQGSRILYQSEVGGQGMTGKSGSHHPGLVHSGVIFIVGGRATLVGRKRLPWQPFSLFLRERECDKVGWILSQ